MPKATRPIDHEELLSQVARLRGLARRLVLDESRADDVVQQGLLAAIENPTREGVALGPWLVGVVRNLARRAHRTESRRARHEAAATQRGNAAAPDEIAAQSEAFRDLADAVHRLDPLYRDVVVLHYFDGLEVRAVAERLGAPIETVRTRLKRGLAQLRERLDAKHGGDGRTWAAALLPFATGGGGVTAPALVQGGLVMTAKTKAALAVAAVVLVALTISVALLGGRDEPPPTETAVVPAPRAASIVVEERAPPPPPAPEPPKPVIAPVPVAVAPPVEKPTAAPPKPAPVVVAEPDGTGTVVGAVRVASTRKPVAGKKVTIEAVGAKTSTASTDAQGRFRFEHLAEKPSWRVRVEADGFAPAVVPNIHLDRDETRDVGTLWLDVPVRLDVVVKDWRDRPIAGATVEAHRSEMFGVRDAWGSAAEDRYVRDPAATATTGADGCAILLTLPRGEWTVVARAAGFAAAQQWSVALVPGAAKREVTIHLDKALRIEGRVVGGDRRPVARAAVWAYNGSAIATGSLAFPHATTDDAGHFVLDGLRPGETTLRVGREGAVPCAVERVRVPSSAPVEIVLDGGIVEGVVTSAEDGKPIAGARVLANMGLTQGVSVAEATTGDDGRYRLDSVRAGRPQSFRVEHPGFVTIDETTPNLFSRPELAFNGVTVQRDFALRRGVPLAGRVTSADGPVAGARVVANWRSRSTSGGSWLASAEGFTDGDGRFELSGVPPTAVVVQVTADGWYQEGLADFEWDIAFSKGKKPARALDVPAAGLSDLRIELTRGCIVTGRVESAAGVPVAGAGVGCAFSRTTTGDDGTFSITSAVIGRAAEIGATSGGAWVSQPIQLSPAGRVDGVVMRLPQTVRVSGRVSTSNGAAVDGASAEVWFRPEKVRFDMREWSVAHVAVVDGGRYDAEFMEQEGKFVVRASAPGFAPADSSETPIESGRATYTADIVLAAQQSVVGRVVSSADGRTPVVGARIALLPGDWEVRAQDRRVGAVAAITDRDGRFRVPAVAAGDGFIDVTADGFVHSITPIKGPSGDELLLRADPSFEIAGVVKLPNGAVASDVWDGTAISGVWVGLRLEHDERRDGWWSVATGADGRFRVSGLPRGTYTVSTNVYGGTISVARFVATGVPAGKTDMEIALRTAGEIAGRVLAPDGRPLAGCSVQAFSETGDSYTPSATTKDDGTFVVRGIGAGTFRLEAKPPDAERTGYVSVGAQLRAAKATGVAAGAKNVEIKLTGGLTIRGVLLDARGAPLANAWIRAEPIAGQNLDPGQDSWLFGPGAQTDAAGKFTISGLATARYRLVQVPDPQRFDVSRPLKGGDDVGAGATNVRVVATE